MEYHCIYQSYFKEGPHPGVVSQHNMNSIFLCVHSLFTFLGIFWKSYWVLLLLVCFSVVIVFQENKNEDELVRR